MVVNPTGRTPGTSTVSVLNVRRTCSISPVEESPEFSWNKSLRSQCCFPLQGRVKRSRTCGPRCCLSSWRRCSVCCSRFVPPPHSCRFSTSPSSCRWSTAPSSTAATRLSSAWREYQPHAHAHAHAHAHTSLWTKLLSLFIFTWLNCHLSVSVCAVSRHATLGSCTVWSWLCRQCSLCCSIPASPWWKLWMETLYMWVRSDGTTLNPNYCTYSAPPPPPPPLPPGTFISELSPLSPCVAAGERRSDVAQPARLHPPPRRVPALSTSRLPAKWVFEMRATPRT